MSWETKKLGEVCVLNYGKNLPVSKRSEGDVPVYSSAGLIDFHSESHVESEGIIIGRKGSVGKIYYSDVPFFPIDTSYYINPNEKYNLKFLYYNIQTLGLDNLNTDAAVPGLNRNNAYSQLINVPPLQTQKRIADILSAYDDLIENNLKRIQLLEQAAQNIYKEWFVHMRFPGHENTPINEETDLPEGWKRATIGEIMTLNYGKALKNDDRIEGEYPVFGSSGQVGTHNKSLVRAPGIILGRKGNVGSVFWSFKDFYPIDTVYFIESEIHFSFIYFFLKNQVFVNNDAAVPGLNRKAAYRKEFIVPSLKVLVKFDSTVSSIFDLRNSLLSQNQKLKAARDILLPRLMNRTIVL